MAESELVPVPTDAEGGARMQDALDLRSEMRRATVMMVDIVGSTTIAEKLGPEDSFALLQAVLQIVREAVSRHGGTAVNEMGDGLFALFGAPLSIERASLAACRASLDVVQAIGAAAGRLQLRFGLRPEIRVGLAAGEVLITGLQDRGQLNATGHAVNLAARLQGQARPGGVVVAESVVAEAQGWARFRPMGARGLRGFSVAQDLFELLQVDVDQAARQVGLARYSGAFVGRTAEIDHLHAWIAPQNLTRPICLILGEAGIGKSRLLGEFAARIPGRRLIVGACQPAGTARPLGPIIDILRDFLGFRPGMAPQVLPLDALLPANADGREGLADLVAGRARPEDENSLSRAFALRQALTTALLSLGQRPEIIVAVEDLHWIDPLSADVFLNVVAAAPEGFRMLGTSRPGDWVADLPHDRFDLLNARPLDKEDIAAIARAMIDQIVDAEFAGEVARQSEGNPFFAIEILHSVAQATRMEAGRIGAIQNVALARFDLLDGVNKALLRVASVLGRGFRLDVLQTAAEVSRAQIDALVAAAAGIIEPDPAAPATSARFRHILFRDSIYATIPSAARKMAHLAAAEALRKCLPDQLSEYSEVLADHYETAGDALNAVRFLTLAGHRAFGLYALQSCHALTDRAMRLIEGNPAPFEQAAVEEVLSIHLRCLDLEDLFRDVVSVFKAWSARLLTPQSSAEQVLMMAITSKSLCHLQKFPEAHQLALEALEIANRLGDARAIAYVKVVLLRILMDSQEGCLAKAEELFEDTRAFTEAQADGSLYAHRMFNMIAAYRSEGMLGKAIALNRTFLEFGEKHRLAHVIAVANWNLAHSAQLSRDYAAGLAYAETSLKYAFGNRATSYIGRNLRAANLNGLGQAVPIADLKWIEDLADTGGDLVSRNGAALNMAYSLLISGRIADGWRQAQHAFALYRNSGHIAPMRFMLVLEAELRLTLCGLIKSGRPAPKLGLADMLLLIRLRLTVCRKVKALLAELLAKLPQETGYMVARAHVCLGLVAAHERKPAVAKDHFDTAERLFLADGLDSEVALMKKWRTAAGLEPKP